MSRIEIWSHFFSIFSHFLTSPLKWEHVVYSLYELGYDMHVGGRTALDLGGHAHYIPLGVGREMHVYALRPFPAWVHQLCSSYNVAIKRIRFLTEVPEGLVTGRPFGHWDWMLPCATPALGLFEMLDHVRTETDFQVVDPYFEGMFKHGHEQFTTLLKACNKVVTNRLFLWFLERHNHPLLDSLDLSAVNLGSGKRVVVKGGRFDKQYQITVARRMPHDHEDPDCIF